MKIACLSGKGGAGKTMVAVNLAVTAGADTYIDCDVEEPNGYLFFQPEKEQQEEVAMMLPVFDETKCDGCRKCVEFCRFHALMYVKEKPVVFSEVCHSCGGCMILCPKAAVKEAPKVIGMLETGRYGNLKVVTGMLNPGEASGVPIIRQALKKAEGVTILDCPPGSACSVMESVMDADFCLLVAEPTAFGFHNFKMVHELVELLHKKYAVIVNKQNEIFEPLEQYCAEKGISVLARIPYDSQVAEMVAKGKIVSESRADIRKIFQEVYSRIGGV